ncbi:MAG: hypothetical protein J0L84_11285 [Verrucomicrobia bacterium]|nr:hypothetical protein [Verrucomicrobiota bacterium]MBN8428014.1 hypothetical protein [Xanthomonadales bacterium]
MTVSEQAPAPPPVRRGLPGAVLRAAATIAIALGIAWACGAAMRADARLADPPGLFRGMLHGAMMPVAWPTLLAGQDQEIYAGRNAGRPYKLGYSLGVNLSGLVFFGWLFLTVGSLRGLVQRRSPQ